MKQIAPAALAAWIEDGGRSMQVALFLERNGFSKVRNLAGGVDAWSKSVDPSVPLY